MIKHDDLWKAIESIAEQNNTSCAGLAKMGGLDVTIFNKSKRYTTTGKPRWVSMYSIAKVLNATNTSMLQFAALFPEE